MATQCLPSRVTRYAWWWLSGTQHCKAPASDARLAWHCVLATAERQHSLIVSRRGHQSQTHLQETVRQPRSPGECCAGFLNLMCKRVLALTEDGLVQHHTSCPTARAGYRPVALCLLGRALCQQDADDAPAAAARCLPLLPSAAAPRCPQCQAGLGPCPAAALKASVAHSTPDPPATGQTPCNETRRAHACSSTDV